MWVIRCHLGPKLHQFPSFGLNQLIVTRIKFHNRKEFWEHNGNNKKLDGENVFGLAIAKKTILVKFSQDENFFSGINI